MGYRPPPGPSGSLGYRRPSGSGHRYAAPDDDESPPMRGRDDADDEPDVDDLPPPQPPLPPVTGRRDPNNPWRADCRRQNPDNDPSLNGIEACRQADLWDNGPRQPTTAPTPPPPQPPNWARSAAPSGPDPEPLADPQTTPALVRVLSDQLTAAGVSVTEVAKCMRSFPRAARCLFGLAGIPPDDGVACFSTPWPAPCMGALIDQYGKTADRILADKPKW